MDTTQALIVGSGIIIVGVLITILMDRSDGVFMSTTWLHAARWDHIREENSRVK